MSRPAGAENILRLDNAQNMPKCGQICLSFVANLEVDELGDGCAGGLGDVGVGDRVHWARHLNPWRRLLGQNKMARSIRESRRYSSVSKTARRWFQMN